MPRIVLVVLVLMFTIYCIVDVVRTPQDRVRTLTKAAWLVVTLFPAAGGIAWLLTGRPRGETRQPPRRGPLGPDDDPDFLRGL